MIQIDPLEDGISSVSLIETCGNDQGIVRAARVSFANDLLPSDAIKDFKLIKYLLKHNHQSPFYHNLLTFRITAPIFIDRQMVRHHVGVAKNEESARYTEVKEQFYTPKEFRSQSTNNRQASVKGGLTEDEQDFAERIYKEAVNNAFYAYRDLIRNGVSREQARGVLNLATYTSSYYTFNLGALLNFLRVRDHEGSQYEIQLYARAMRTLVEPVFPMVFAALEELK